MSIRRDPIYLSYGVWRSLRLIAKAKSEESNIVTADQLADEFLSAVITEKYPQLFEHHKQIDKMERELLKTL